MAELNFGLLNPPGSQSIGNAFVTGMDQASAARAQENQNALAQYTLSKAKREDQVKNQFLAELRAATTPEQQQQAYINAGMGKEAAEIKDIGLKTLETQGRINLQPGQMAASAAATAASNATRMREIQAFTNQATRDLALNPSDDNIRAYGQDAVLKGIFTQAQADEITARQLAIPMDQRAAQFRQAGAAAAAPQATPAEINTMTQLGFPLTPEGYAAFRASQQPRKLLSDEEFEQQLRLRQEGRPPPTTKLLTPAEFAQQVELRRAGRPPQAPAMKPLTEGQTIKLRTDVGKDYKNASMALAQMDDVLMSAALVRTAPGLDAATGYTGMLPSFTGGAAAQAETRLANLRGKITAAAKAAASMGGAIGPIATAEWKILSDQIAALNEVKGKGPLLEQISGLETQMIGAAERIRDAYEKTRGEDFERFPQFANLPPPKSAIKPKTPTAPGTPAAAQGTGGFTYLGKESSK